MATASLPTRSTASVLVVSADRGLRARLNATLSRQRWEVLEAGGGAEALLLLEDAQPQAVLLEGSLPDLEAQDFADELLASHPGVELVALDGALAEPPRGSRGPRRGELVQALQAACEAERGGEPAGEARAAAPSRAAPSPAATSQAATSPAATSPAAPSPAATARTAGSVKATPPPAAQPSDGPGGAMPARVPELVGEAPSMLELSRRIRLVAARTTTVLIQGPTGSGKEVVARALHRLSPRSSKPFVALNCAAIPEALLEAELFGHARGAFTGAVQRRTGRIEAAQGGTLFLDEIGEMPLALQAKLLRFLESGELQRVGENETTQVNVRILAATHQPLARRAQEGSFRADLFYRLSVFRIETPALCDHPEDLPALAAHFLERLGEGSPKSLEPAAMARLRAHCWPGNVRELQHVLERAAILAEDRAGIGPAEIEFDLP